MAVSINHLTSNITLQVTQPYLVVDDEGLKAFAVGIQGPPSGATVALAGLTDVDNAAVPTNRFIVIGDGTKFVTRGILGDDLPTGIDATKIANGLVSNTEFQYLDGVTSSIQTQIDGKAANSHVHSGVDITSGTLPAARLNGGNSSQFVRGDGTYSNTLTGDFVAGEIAFLSEGPGYPNLYGGTGSGPGYFYIAAGDSTQGAGNIYLYPESAGGSNSGAVEISSWGASAPVRIYHNNTSRFSTTTTGVFLTGDVALSTSGKIIYGATGSNVVANRETYGFLGGIRTNTPMGTTLTESVAGAVITSVSSAGLAVTGNLSATTASFSGAVATGALTVTGTMAASGAVSGTTGTFSGNLTTNGQLLVTTAGNVDSALSLRPGGTSITNFLNFLNSAGGYHGYLQTTGSGGFFSNFDSSTFRSLGGTNRLTINSSGVTLADACKIIYGSAGTTTAANNEIVGATGGLRYNVASGLAHTLLVAGTSYLTLNATSTTVANNLIVSGSGGLISTAASMTSYNSTSFVQGSTGATAYTYNGPVSSTFTWRFNGVAFTTISHNSVTAKAHLATTGNLTGDYLILTGAAPATATSTGTAGQIAWDANFFYVCTATNTWKRTALSTW